MKQCTFLMYKLSMKILDLPHLSNLIQLLVEFRHILRVFDHLPISLVRSVQSIIDIFVHAQVGVPRKRNLKN